MLRDVVADKEKIGLRLFNQIHHTQNDPNQLFTVSLEDNNSTSEPSIDIHYIEIHQTQYRFIGIHSQCQPEGTVPEGEFNLANFTIHGNVIVD